LSWDDIAEALDAVKTLCPSPLPLALATHDAALRLAGAHRFHIDDALIVAAALESECAKYSEDLHAGQVIDGQLTIRNPFTN